MGAASAKCSAGGRKVDEASLRTMRLIEPIEIAGRDGCDGSARAEIVGTDRTVLFVDDDVPPTAPAAFVTSDRLLVRHALPQALDDVPQSRRIHPRRAAQRALHRCVSGGKHGNCTTAEVPI